MPLALNAACHRGIRGRNEWRRARSLALHCFRRNDVGDVAVLRFCAASLESAACVGHRESIALGDRMRLRESAMGEAKQCKRGVSLGRGMIGGAHDKTLCCVVV